MATIKSWFRGRDGQEKEPPPVDDLIALGRYEEAEERLRNQLRTHSRDLHTRLKLADLLLQMERRPEALEEYIEVADGHAREGFYRKARALLGKVDRLIPGQDRVRQKLESIERLRNADRRRDLVIDALLEQPAGEGGSSAFHLQRMWRDLATHPMIDRLSDAQLQRVFSAFRMRHFGEGDLLADTRSGEPRILLVASGEVEAQTLMASGKRTVIRSFGPGDLIGDRSLLEHRPWPAEYRASKSSAVLELTRERLENALVGETDPKGLLDALRAQRHDHDVAAALAKLKAAD